MMYESGHGFAGGFMWIFWILLIVVIFWIINSVKGNNITLSEKPKSALDIIKERYAKGEIDEQEYEQKRKTLMK